MVALGERSSRIMRRGLQPLTIGAYIHAFVDVATQAGNSLLLPLISTRHKRTRLHRSALHVAKGGDIDVFPAPLPDGLARASADFRAHHLKSLDANGFTHANTLSWNSDGTAAPCYRRQAGQRLCTMWSMYSSEYLSCSARIGRRHAQSAQGWFPDVRKLTSRSRSSMVPVPEQKRLSREHLGCAARQGMHFPRTRSCRTRRRAPR